MFYFQGVSETISVSVLSSISDVASRDWDACALDATGPEKFNPFLTHAFLSSLEETGCAVKVRLTALTPISISPSEVNKLG